MGGWSRWLDWSTSAEGDAVVTDLKVSRTKTVMIVVKIVMGLGQVVSKQPDVVKQDFPGPQW